MNLKKNDLSTACDRHCGRRSAYRILMVNLKERDQLGNLDVDGNLILKLIFKNLGGAKEWIDLAQDKDKWRALVNAVMNLRVS